MPKVNCNNCGLRYDQRLHYCPNCNNNPYSTRWQRSRRSLSELLNRIKSLFPTRSHQMAFAAVILGTIGIYTIFHIRLSTIDRVPLPHIGNLMIVLPILSLVTYVLFHSATLRFRDHFLQSETVHPSDVRLPVEGYVAGVLGISCLAVIGYLTYGLYGVPGLYVKSYQVRYHAKRIDEPKRRAFSSPSFQHEHFSPFIRTCSGRQATLDDGNLPEVWSVEETVPEGTRVCLKVSGGLQSTPTYRLKIYVDGENVKTTEGRRAVYLLPWK